MENKKMFCLDEVAEKVLTVGFVGNDNCKCDGLSSITTLTVFNSETGELYITDVKPRVLLWNYFMGTKDGSYKINSPLFKHNGERADIIRMLSESECLKTSVLNASKYVVTTSGLVNHYFERVTEQLSRSKKEVIDEIGKCDEKTNYIPLCDKLKKHERIFNYLSKNKTGYGNHTLSKYALPIFGELLCFIYTSAESMYHNRFTEDGNEYATTMFRFKDDYTTIKNIVEWMLEESAGNACMYADISGVVDVKVKLLVSLMHKLQDTMNELSTLDSSINPNELRELLHKYTRAHEEYVPFVEVAKALSPMRKYWTLLFPTSDFSLDDLVDRVKNGIYFDEEEYNKKTHRI